jgi:hypothetical protein
MTSFTGKEKHIVKVEDARQYIENYRESAAQGSVFGGFFGKLSLLAILNQPDCVGIRYYHGRDISGNEQLVLVGVKEDGSEIVDGHIASRAVKCPPACGIPPTLAY